MMVAPCMAEAAAAMARGKIAGGTMLGSSAWVVGCSKARAVPRQKARMKISSRVTAWFRLPTSSTRAISPWPVWQRAATRRRS